MWIGRKLHQGAALVRLHHKGTRPHKAINRDALCFFLIRFAARRVKRVSGNNSRIERRQHQHNGWVWLVQFDRDLIAIGGHFLN